MFDYVQDEPKVSYLDAENGTNGEDCVAMETRDRSSFGQWKDLSCDRLLGYICKKKGGYWFVALFLFLFIFLMLFVKVLC